VRAGFSCMPCQEPDSKPTSEQWAEAIQLLLDSTVPERKDEFRRLWRQYDPIVSVIGPRAGFTMEGAGSEIYGVIQFSPKDLRLIWLIGFTSWRAVQAYSGLIFDKAAKEEVLDLAALELLEAENVAVER